jgi:N6-L-threonylcarbamoyladenine synthase
MLVVRYEPRMAMQIVLGFETSCDDTSVAIVQSNGTVLALCSAHQDLAHRPYGGIVPEIASRNHTLQILPTLQECLKKAQISWDQIDGLAVTNRPGLLGSLLVGVVTVKTLALAKGLPFVGVNHLEAHLLAPFLRDETSHPPADFDFPYLALAVSGGHTQLCHVHGLGKYEVLGQTLDDAAGEALDKFAKMLGLGFPGGPAVDRWAQNAERVDAYSFPKAMEKSAKLDFSFSGLKTSAMRLLERLSTEEIERERALLCASFQQAVVDSLLERLTLAAQRTSLRRVVITGGVSANSRLRFCAQQWADQEGFSLVIPQARYCTDNGAMVAYTGLRHMQKGRYDDQTLAPLARSPL